MAAKGKNNKQKGGPQDNELPGDNGDDFVDGKSGDDSVAGGSGSDWVKGGSGNDVLNYDLGLNADTEDLYDGGSGVDALMLHMSFDDWMRVDIQDDIADYLPWLVAHLNKKGTATGQTYQFNAVDLDARKFESLRVTVDGVELNPEDEAVRPVDDAFEIDEDQSVLSGNVLQNDDVPDLVRSVESVTTAANGTVQIYTSGDFSYSYGDAYQYLAAGETASDQFVYRVTDADFDAEDATVSITILGVNDLPVANEDSVATDENATVSIDALLNDTDIDISDTHTIDAAAIADDGRPASIPALAAPTVSIENNEVVFRPGEGYDYLSVGETATARVDYAISDNNGGTAQSSISVLINGENDAPVATNDSAQVGEDSQVSVDVLANDTDVDQSDTLSLTAVSQSSLGGLARIENGSIVFSADGDFESLALGEQTAVTLDYEIADNHGALDEASLTLQVLGANDAPTALDDLSSAEENEIAQVDVLANDTDIDSSDTHTLDAVSILDDGRPGSLGGSGAAVSISNNQLVFNPGSAYDYLAVGESTTANIEYTMSDNNGAAASAVLQLTITGTNDRPIATGDAREVDEGEAILLDVLANDSDVDQSDTLEIDSFTQPSKGVVTLAGGKLQYEASGSFAGLALGEEEEVNFSYRVEDGNGGSDTAQVSVTVIGTNEAPTAHMDEAVTTESGTVLVDVLDNDTDPDTGDVLTIASAQLVYGKGKVSIESGQIRFDTDGAYEQLGIDQRAEAIVEYTVTDESGESSTSAAFITISGEYDAPFIVENLDDHSFGAMTADYASDWHMARFEEQGSYTTLTVNGSAVEVREWNSNWDMGFQNQELFGLDTPPGGLREEVSEEFVIDTGDVDLIGIDLLWDAVGTGAEFNAGFNARFGAEFTPYVAVDGGTIGSEQGISVRFAGGEMTSDGFLRLDTDASMDAGSLVDFDFPDGYLTGLDAKFFAEFGFYASAKGEFLGNDLFEWDVRETLVDANTGTLNIMEAGVDTVAGGLSLSLLGSDPVVYTKDIQLPKGIGQIQFFGEEFDFEHSTQIDPPPTLPQSAIGTGAVGAQQITGIRFDLDDLLGNVPKAGIVFANLDNRKAFNIGDVGGIEFDYTILGAGFTLGLNLDAESHTRPEFTADLVFDRPVYVEGFDDPVMALRNADWFDLPGIKSADGQAVTVTPYFNSQYQLNSDLGINLTGIFDYKVGEVSARVYIEDVFDTSLPELGPILSGTETVFDIRLIGVDDVDIASTGYDQFAGNAFVFG